MKCKTARSPCQPIHEQEDITRSSNPVAEARTFLEQTPEEKKSNGSAGFRFHLLHVRLAAFTKAGMYSVSFPPHVRCALPRCQLTLVKTRVERLPGQQVDSSWGPVTPVHELLAVMTRVLQISHCTREVSLVCLQGDQPIHCAPHILFCLRVVLEQGCTGHGSCDTN